ncbi:MAG TPA: hypothetical protein VKF84_16200 [Candidatus Sulfotelmatobacter sp.]|jgi:hypothetical protein|nr:hypothetical protein [Candidatus Sulfotelmatobacter sp.]
MADHIRVPVKIVGGDRWGQLSAFGDAHLICGENVKPKDQNFSFAGGHRVRLFSFKKNVHWKIPDGIPLDVAAVAPATAAPRRQQR